MNYSVSNIVSVFSSELLKLEWLNKTLVTLVKCRYGSIIYNLS